MNKILKTRIDSIVNGQILDYVERSYPTVIALAHSEPSVEVWDCNSHKVTRLIEEMEDDQVLVVFCVSRKILFGLASKVSERGLIFHKNGRVREALDTELDGG